MLRKIDLLLCILFAFRNRFAPEEAVINHTVITLMLYTVHILYIYIYIYTDPLKCIAMYLVSPLVTLLPAVRFLVFIFLL